LRHSDSPADNQITDTIINVAHSIYHRLGPGCREQLYQEMLADDMADLGHIVAVERAVPLVVDGRTRSLLYPDLVVDDTVVVECKVTPDWLSDMDLVQLLTYLAICQLPVGVLLNFGLPRLEYRHALPPRRPEEWIRRVAPYLRRARWQSPSPQHLARGARRTH
jgi:GxxExxY protein